MDQNRINRMNILFEKMVSRVANTHEKRELDALYSEFFHEGRDQTNARKVTQNFKWVVHS